MSPVTQQSKRATDRSQKMISPLLRVGLLLGVVVHLIGFLVFRVVSSPLPDSDTTGPYVEYVSAGSLASDRELEEQAALFDSAPLFIPTRWNASQMIFVDSGHVLRGQFPEFEPEIDLLNELEPSSSLVAQHVKLDEPMDLLTSQFWRFFAGFAETPTPIVAFPNVLPMAEVTVIGEPSARALSIPVELDYSTSSPVARPVLYYLRLSGNGLAMSSPTLGESSGNEDFDRAAGEWLRRPEVLAQLPKGYLSVQVFPW